MQTASVCTVWILGLGICCSSTHVLWSVTTKREHNSLKVDPTRCTYIGSCKERMDLVDSNLRVLDVISVFGPYAKFLDEEIGGGKPMIVGERYVRNVSLMVQYKECYQPLKLSSIAKQELAIILDDYTFTCGADLKLISTLSEVCCNTTIEKLYYS